MNYDGIQTFDPKQSYSVVWRRLPHWVQAGTVCFITFRTADSMPRAVIERWIVQRNELLRTEGIVVDAAGFGPSGIPWKTALRQLPLARRSALQYLLTARWAFDHLIRSSEEFDRYRSYIADNGFRAHLSEHEYLRYSKL